ncbi:carboxylesterase family protein [Microbacterium panaciterrae]|uniref:Carboxylic ester hydrolase n=1 Tax=Microbacterium panaciterrae TaxID=985759 RepID=A0ABP8PVB3_9MICO
MSTRLIATTDGPVLGRSLGRTTAYLGLPFSAPPLGDLRFAAPRPHLGWAEPLAADAFGASPVQPETPLVDGLPLSEDCLTLNVWVPEGAADADVLFWVYGGGFEGGSSALPIFDGARLAAEQRMIVVSANHRTGALGFATLIDHGLPEASNLGLRDVIAALRWVRRNAAAFGGDPDRVTVMGQSSGAFLAAALLAAPAAAGLFQGLVLISGGASRIVPLMQARRHAAQFVAAAGIPEDDALVRLHELSGAEILAAQRVVGSREIGRRNAPVPDSFGVVLDVDAPHPVLTAHPLQAIADGQARDIPLLFVVAGAEVASLRGADEEFSPKDVAQIVAELGAWGVPDPAEVVAAYATADLAVTRERILTDYIYRLPAARAAIGQNAAGGRSWVAQVDRPDDSPADHNLPARLLFGNVPDGSPEAGLSGRLRQMIGAFIREGSLPWARFEGPRSEVMHLGGSCRTVSASFSGILDHWKGTPRP